jgi:hypothetical protein
VPLYSCTSLITWLGARSRDVVSYDNRSVREPINPGHCGLLGATLFEQNWVGLHECDAEEQDIMGYLLEVATGEPALVSQALTEHGLNDDAEEEEMKDDEMLEEDVKRSSIDGVDAETDSSD